MISGGLGEFSHQTRKEALHRFRNETFDFLIIGGGITGAATARDAASRGLKVALVERRDFASGTSSRSSKLIHGGLRYLQSFELHLVFEALAERALLLKTVPVRVRPVPFYLPVYQGDRPGKSILGLGLWLYDTLALFRTPGFHKRLSRKQVLQEIPFLKPEGLSGGFRYFDATMWDDVLAVETLRSAHAAGAALANYVEGIGPLWDGDRVSGFRVRDLELPSGQGEIDLRARRVIVCAGPWTDLLGARLSSKWAPWLMPSKGVHLVFDSKRLPVPGAMVMNHPEDGRISFVIPRPDFGAGVVIVGTTDGPTAADPEKAEVASADVGYLMNLLRKYFPSLDLKTSDILSAYVGVRPLMGGGSGVGDGSSHAGDAAGPEGHPALQKVSREHYIGDGPGGTIVVAGGKYTTHRRMAQEIVDHALKSWKRDFKVAKAPEPPSQMGKSATRAAVNPAATPAAIETCRAAAARRNLAVPEELLQRYGSEAMDVLEIQSNVGAPKQPDPPAFPLLAAQLRHAIRTEMVLHLEDFYLRRVPLFLSRADHGLPWAEMLAQVWADERGLGRADAQAELDRLRAEVERRTAWAKNLPA